VDGLCASYSGVSHETLRLWTSEIDPLSWWVRCMCSVRRVPGFQMLIYALRSGVAVVYYTLQTGLCKVCRIERPSLTPRDRGRALLNLSHV
jgi:hypothetical protein